MPSGTNKFIAPCANDAELDCIESIGAYVNGSLVKGTLTGTTAPTADGGVSGHEWSIPGLTNEDSKSLVETQVKLTGNDVSVAPCTAKCLVGVAASIFATSQGSPPFRPEWESKLDTCTTNKIDGKCVRYGNLQDGVKFTMTVRTSWVVPSIISSKNSDTSVAVEKLATSGASRVTVSGIPYRTLGVDPPQMRTVDSATSRGAWAQKQFNVTILDGRQFAYYESCYDKPTLVVADNTWGPSTPTFDRTSGALDLRVMNPHFDTDNTTEFAGAYQSRIPLETARCLWGDKIASANQFSVEVFETAGTTKTATTSVKIEDEIVKIDAAGFTFSSPTIRVKANQTAAPTTPAGSTTAAAPATPAKPTKVKTTLKKRVLTVTFTRQTGVTYKVVAKSGKTTRTLKCKASGSTSRCLSTVLPKGTWKVTVTPKNSSGVGTAWSKSVRVR